MSELMGLLTTGIPLWFLLFWWLILNPAIENLPEPRVLSSPFYRWFYGFANSVAGNFQEALKYISPKK